MNLSLRIKIWNILRHFGCVTESLSMVWVASHMTWGSHALIVSWFLKCRLTACYRTLKNPCHVHKNYPLLHVGLRHANYIGVSPSTSYQWGMLMLFYSVIKWYSAQSIDVNPNAGWHYNQYMHNAASTGTETNIMQIGFFIRVKSHFYHNFKHHSHFLPRW